MQQQAILLYIQKHPFKLLKWWVIIWFLVIYYAVRLTDVSTLSCVLSSTLLNMGSVIGPVVPLILLSMIHAAEIQEFLLSAIVQTVRVVKARINQDNSAINKLANNLQSSYHKLRQIESDMYLGFGGDAEFSECQDEFIRATNDFMYAVGLKYR